MKGWQGPRACPGPRCQSSSARFPRHSHPSAVRPQASASRATSRAGGRGLRPAAPHTVSEAAAGGGGGRGPGRARGREAAPGRGGGGAADAEERDARGGRRLRAAAGRGALEARPARGRSRELHEVPPGPRTGRCPGEAVGGSPTSMARRGPRRRARSKSGSGGSAEGRGPEVGRGDSGPDRGGRSGLSRCQSAAPPRSPAELPAPRRSAPWLFWKLANVFVEREMGEGREGVTETELEAAGRTEAKAGGARDRLTGRRTERPGRRRAPAARAQAGLRPETGRGCRRQPWTGWGSEGAERLRAGGPTTEGFSVGAKVGIASPSCTPGAAQNAPPAPPPVTLTAELKITAPCAPRRPRPQPLPRPLPHWAWDEATAPSSPKEKKRKKRRRGGAGGGPGAGGPAIWM